ncbi:hypothetical protein PHMEG_00020689 [Phytophthora megakarya]|uniref:Transposase n=1 Tax=Phytophthora megakarya TaxID=4795 RepID=A0A225VN67_9STRA|nr:hypothetical protein PHMEG_00020689 [Phytophthora megakarya]
MASELYDISNCEDYTFVVITAAWSTDVTAIDCGFTTHNKIMSVMQRADETLPLSQTVSLQQEQLPFGALMEERSFFVGQGFMLKHAVMVLIFWAKQEKSIIAIQMPKHSSRTLTDWYMFCRDICTRELLHCRYRYIGGQEHVVEIDETSMKKKSNNNVGTRHPDYWIFGGLAHYERHVASYVTADGSHSLENNPFLEGITHSSREWVILMNGLTIHATLSTQKMGFTHNASKAPYADIQNMSLPHKSMSACGVRGSSHHERFHSSSLMV